MDEKVECTINHLCPNLEKYSSQRTQVHKILNLCPWYQNNIKCCRNITTIFGQATQSGLFTMIKLLYKHIQ